MNTATSNLKRDHEHILQLTEVMDRISRSGNTDIKHCEMIVDIIKNFADGLHHNKEENLLFPLMAERGFPVQGGPVGVMLMEHEQGREYVRGMSKNNEAFKAGDNKAIQKVYENMQGYAELLRNHIYKENNILFNMADGVFTEEDQKDLLAKFEKIETEGSIGTDYFLAIEELAKAYPV